MLPTKNATINFAEKRIKFQDWSKFLGILYVSLLHSNNNTFTLLYLKYLNICKDFLKMLHMIFEIDIDVDMN